MTMIGPPQQNGGMTVELLGVKELTARLAALTQELRGQAIASALYMAAAPLVNAWKRELLTIRWTDSKGVAHTDLVETGTYLRSIHTRIIHDASGMPAVGVGTDISAPPYPWWLEYGRSNMSAKRPAQNAIKKAAPAVKDELMIVLSQLLARYDGGAGRKLFRR